MSDWLFDNLGWVVLFVLALFFAGVFALAIESGKARERFMQECTEDRKRYECEAMWRAGESHFVIGEETGPRPFKGNPS